MDIYSFMPEEKECLDTLRSLRWSDNGPICVRCGSDWVIKRGFDKAGYRRYLCRSCNVWFGDKTGTVFEGSKISLGVWFMLAFLMQYKISILEASKTLAMPYKTVFYMVERLRGSIYAQKIVEKLRGTVEIDELYLTAGLKGKKGSGIQGGQVSRPEEEEPISVTSLR